MKKPLATIRRRCKGNSKTDPKLKERDAMDCILLPQDGNEAWSPIKSRKLPIKSISTPL